MCQSHGKNRRTEKSVPRDRGASRSKEMVKRGAWDSHLAIVCPTVVAHALDIRCEDVLCDVVVPSLNALFDHGQVYTTQRLLSKV